MCSSTNADDGSNYTTFLSASHHLKNQYNLHYPPLDKTSKNQFLFCFAQAKIRSEIIRLISAILSAHTNTATTKSVLCTKKIQINNVFLKKIAVAISH